MGESILSILPNLNTSISCVAEQLHSLYIGVVYLFTSLLIKSTGTPFSLKNKMAVIDTLMLEIAPPSYFPRKPRKLSEFEDTKLQSTRMALLALPLFGSYFRKIFKT